MRVTCIVPSDRQADIEHLIFAQTLAIGRQRLTNLAKTICWLLTVEAELTIEQKIPGPTKRSKYSSWNLSDPCLHNCKNLYFAYAMCERLWMNRWSIVEEVLFACLNNMEIE